ncbi:MAG: M48 family metallopeptidase [Desulfosporosinus sp.]|nr:M48 family metallopeptidase [Desulfosporosinus sp.]
MNYLSVDDFRVRGEKTILYITLSVVGVLFLFALGVSLGFIILVVIISAIWVKIRQGQLLGQGIKVSENQLSEIYNTANIAAKRLCMSLPDIFVIQNPMINASAIGFMGKKCIVLHSATVEAMGQEELLAVIGHEFTHIKAGHTNWLVITSSTGSIQIPIISQLTGFIFLFWSRKAEYTCDRGAVLASRDPKATVNALAKVAVGKELFKKLNIDHLFNQKMNIDEDEVSKLAESLAAHPYIINRIHAISKFYKSPKYSKLSATVT